MADIIIGGLVLLSAVAAARHVYKTKKNGGCAGGCSGCGGCPSQRSNTGDC